MLTPHAEEYLEAIYRLGGGDGPVRLSALAEHMGLSAVSVNEMVRRLEEQSLLQYTPYVGTQLTEEGLWQALAVLRRHRLWERFLTDVLGLSWDSVHEEACRLEHAESEVVTERLADVLRQILRRIVERGSWTTEELARELGTTTQMVSAMMGELARQGYVEPLGTPCSARCGAACTACAQADRCASGAPERVWTARPDRRGQTPAGAEQNIFPARERSGHRVGQTPRKHWGDAG